MKRLLPIISAILASVALVSSSQCAAPNTDGNIRVLLTYGGHSFEEKSFIAMFEAMRGIKVTKAPLPESADMLKPGLERDCDVIVRYDMEERITPRQELCLH